MPYTLFYKHFSPLWILEALTLLLFKQTQDLNFSFFQICVYLICLVIIFFLKIQRSYWLGCYVLQWVQLHIPRPWLVSEIIGTKFINREGVSMLSGRRGPLQAATTAKTVDSNITNYNATFTESLLLTYLRGISTVWQWLRLRSLVPAIQLICQMSSFNLKDFFLNSNYYVLVVIYKVT